MAPPLVVVFDVNETLSDLAALRRRCSSVGAPPGTVDLWLAGVLRDGIALAAVGDFATFTEIGRSLLVDLLRRESGVEADPAEAAEQVLAAFGHLDVHRDVPDGIHRLAEAGVRLVTLTNTSAALTEMLLARAGLRDCFELVLDVEPVRRWKPAPEPYLHAVDRANVQPHDAAMVAVHPWDVDGARRAGLVSAFLGRGHHYPAHLKPPEVRGSTLPEVAAALLCR
ncbi:MAG TPA: haloacid dehalogenase type II [Kineosporiaceae bacterium]